MPDRSKSEQEYRTIIQASMDSFWKVGMDGRIIDCNEAACAMLGYTRDELLAQSLHDVDAIEDAEHAAEHMRLIISQGHDRFETRHRRKDGSSIDVEVSAYCVPGAEAPLLFAFSRDISARKAADKALQQSEAHISSILRTAPAGIGLLVDRVFHEVNEAFAAMTGYAVEELVGRSARMIYPTDEDFDSVGREKYRQIREGGIGRVETRFRTKDGRIIDVALSSAPVVPGDLSRGVTFTAQDITAIKRAEQERLAREARQRDALVREVHHRIKNHLQGVSGMLRGMVGDHPEGARLLEKAIARVRAISQVYGLQSTREDARVRLCDLLRTAAANTLGPVQVACQLPPTGTEVILAPEEAVPMALVINELITNSLKHIDQAVPQWVNASLEIAGNRANLQIRNGPARLPPKFDFANLHGIGTGLELVAALLPQQGALLDIRQEGDEVVAELMLEPPVIQV
jgi:PAS domain S-box-containing protein